MHSPQPLCDRCKTINFDALRGPSAIDIERLARRQAPDYRHAQIPPGTSVEKVDIGTLSRIQKYSLSCPLCALFHKIIQRQGAVYWHHSAYETLDSPDIFFRADPDLSYYAKIGGLDIATDEIFVFRRLDLTAHAVHSPDNAIAYFDNVLQICNVDTLSAIADDPATQSRRTAKRMPFGGRKRPPLLDLHHVRDWMRICADEHGRLCSLDSAQVDGTHMDIIRLVDVRQESIQEFHGLKLAEIKFVALSYVWGSSPSVKLWSANRTSMQKSAALSGIPIPRTITDSMSFVAKLGLQYLWVDALCIIQDDANDQSYQIGKMASVYHSAYLTIVAAHGEDSSAGLVGLGSLTRSCDQHGVVVQQPSELNDGLSVVNTLKSCPRHCEEWYTRGQEDVDFSKWSKRAWTVQEKALSRRTLVFTKEQVFWNCQQGYFCEESHFEVPYVRLKHFYPSVHRLGIHQLTEKNSDLWQVYGDLIQNYMLRDLTYKGDVHAAFQGILNAMGDSTKSGFLYGLPLARFELGLLWETFHGVERREALSTFSMSFLKKPILFPTWSWMGWIGDIHCRVGDTRRESESPSVVCFIHRKQPLRFCHVTAMTGVPSRSDLWTNVDLQKQEVSAKQLDQNLPRLTTDILAHHAEECLLFFWTTSALFRVVYDDSSRPVTSFSEYAEQKRPILQDESGNPVGFVCKTATANRDARPQEFVAVGRRQIQGIPEELCPPVILALQVSRDHFGICSRVNYAEIDRKVWMHAKPKPALVALQ